MHTDKYAVFAAWAPPNIAWSRWAKPSIFAHVSGDTLNTATASISPELFQSAIYPPSKDRCALVIDLPGPQAVNAGLVLARCGYRPVPLFNSCPPDVSDTLAMIGAAVDARAVLDALVRCAADLAAITLPDDAPPAFLLDAQRRAPGTFISERMFDNRSVVFPSDFPSGTFLRAQGIRAVRIVHDPSTAIGEDLRYALRHWPKENVAVEAVTPTGEAFPFTWPRAGILGEILTRFNAMLTLRRNPTGGFGRLVPEASGG